MGLMQEAIDRSMSQANAFTQAMFGELVATADEVISFVNSARLATIATANNGGTPHAAVVIVCCHEEQIYFTVTPSSIMARNLAARPAMAFSVSYGDRSIMGQGTAKLVGSADDLSGLLCDLAATGHGGSFTPPDWDGLIYRIDIRRIFTG